MRMRCKPEAPSLDRSFSQFSRQVFCQVRKRPHCRRSLSPAEFGKCGIDAFISRDPRGAAIRPIDGGRVCRSLSATATFHAPPHEHPIPPSWGQLACPLHRGPACPWWGACKRDIFAARGAIELTQPKSHQNHDVAAAANASRRSPLVSLCNSAPAVEKRSA